ncbi:MAG: histidine kinase [Rubrivivax sp.]|nr:histidine kinase [Rubrivivax sp.]
MSAPPVERAAPRAFVIAWAVFWLLLVTLAVQDHLRLGLGALWQPVLWELSSCAVASLFVWRLWPHLPRLDDRLRRPWRWLAVPLALLPVLAPLFVVLAFGIRHAVYALVGATYVHAPWPQLLLYESLKFSIFFLLFAAVVYGMRSFAALHAERARAEALLARAREAQLAQLAQQIEPHFLFNALNTIASAIPEDPVLAERLVVRLATLLRAATDLARRPQVRVDEEVALLRAYAEIMGQRFADRVHVQWQVDPALHAARVPSLILQPLLENAFRHGVERHPGPAHIEIRVERSGPRRARAVVACSLGELADVPLAAAAAAARPPGVGLPNVRQRLALRYGDLARLEVAPRAGGGVQATVEWPLEMPSDEHSGEPSGEPSDVLPAARHGGAQRA